MAGSRQRQYHSEQSDPSAVAYNGLLREQLAEIQRARMLAAMYEVARERGAPNVTVAHVVGRSGVSRRTFYELFADCEDCFLAAFNEAVDRMATVVIPAFQAHEEWSERCRAALAALLQLIDEEPLVGRLVIVETLGAGRRALAQRQAVVSHVVEAVDGGRTQACANSLSPLTAEGVVGAALSVIHARLSQDDRSQLSDLTGELMSIIVLPYLGSAAARRELRRKMPRPEPRKPTPMDPLKDLDMRLTYRTVRVLMAIANTPGASNRKLGDAAGIADQGQISKLLARLTTLGLVQNKGRATVRGEPNAWRLTARGREVAQALGVSAGRG